MNSISRIPLPIVTGGIGYVLAIAIPEGMSGGVGFVIGFVIGTIVILAMICIASVSDQRRLLDTVNNRLIELGNRLAIQEAKSTESESLKNRKEAAHV